MTQINCYLLYIPKKNLFVFTHTLNSNSIKLSNKLDKMPSNISYSYCECSRRAEEDKDLLPLEITQKIHETKYTEDVLSTL